MVVSSDVPRYVVPKMAIRKWHEVVKGGLLMSVFFHGNLVGIFGRTTVLQRSALNNVGHLASLVLSTLTPSHHCITIIYAPTYF